MTFDQFYAQYPRKEAVGRARKAWKKLKPEQIAEIALTLDKQMRVLRAKERQFQCLPATWLNDERWLDELPSMTPAETFVAKVTDEKDMPEISPEERAANIAKWKGMLKGTIKGMER